MKKLIKKLKELQAQGYESVTISQVLEWISYFSWESKTAKLNGKQGKNE